MAYSNSNPGPKETDDSMLSDSSDEQSSDGAKSKAAEKQTFIVPESVCPGMKPGEEMVSEILEVQDGNYLCAYAPEKGHDEGSEPDTKSSSGDSEMASYMS